MLRIGELARQTGFTPKTLRYYEEAGLLRPDGRSQSGYRLYHDAAVERLRLVRSARGLGLRLTDIRRILEISDEGKMPCVHVIEVVDRELERVDTQMERLNDLKTGLSSLRSRLSEAVVLGAPRSSQPCPCFVDDPCQC